MDGNIKEITTYNGFEIGSDIDGSIFVSRSVSDKRYKIREVESLDEAYNYIDALTVKSED